MNMRKAEIFGTRLLQKLLPGARRGCRHPMRAVLALVMVGGVGVGWFGSSAGAIDLASVGIKGETGNSASNGVAVNVDGTVAAFYSDANDLIPGDTNAARDVFVRDLTAGTTQRVSVGSSNQQANRASHATGGPPAISADGTIIAFYSDATNLVANDTNGKPDVFVRLRTPGSTERVSVSSSGAQANNASVSPSISADGRFVAFQSQASNLVANDTNNAADIFVRDRTAGSTERICGSVEGNRYSFSPAISANGNFVAFASAATNLVSGDTNRQIDIFVCNRATGAIDRVSVSSSGVEGNGDSILPTISADGRYVAFKSLADNLVGNDRNGVVDVFLHDRTAGTTERISVNRDGGDGNDFSFPPSISNDGRFVGFGSFATNLAPGDNNRSSDVFVRDRMIGVTMMADVNDRGDQANNGTPDVPPSLSRDGKRIGFVSLGSNLVTNDNNAATDVFVAQNPFFGPGKCPDGVCPDGQVCIEGTCIAPTSTPTVTRTPTPKPTATPTRTPTATATFKPCADDSQCPPDKHCRTGFCKIRRPCDDANPAVDRLACFGDREACIGNLCECGADCNLDGFVFVNEINRAVKILGGLVPLGQCTSADINGDGTVMGNEITLAVLNLSEGCTQEGQPLVFAHDRGGMVTLTVGPATAAPGDTATISLDISGGQGEVATVQLDLLFDPSVVEVGAGACALDPRLTEHVLSVTQPNDPPAPAGLQRLRIFLGDLSAPVAAFADGRIATCAFHVKPGASAATLTLAADRMNVGDARGDVFGSQTVSGGVSILLPTPIPAPIPTARPFCPGDCNGDGEVFVDEITMAVRIMAGETPLSECTAADADGDGEVFVTDVTRAVASLGLGCP